MEMGEILKKYKSVNIYINAGIIVFTVLLLGAISYSGYKYYTIYKTKKALTEQLSLLDIDKKALDGMKLSLESKKKDVNLRVSKTFSDLDSQIIKVTVLNNILDIKTKKQYIKVNLEYKFENSDNVKDLVAKLYLFKDVYKIIKVDKSNIQIIVKGE